MSTLENYINGRFVPTRAGRTREYLNPATNEVLGVATESDTSDVDAAIMAARQAFDEGPWATTPAGERAARLFKVADLIEAHAEELAKLDTLNNGKPLREARYDAADAAGVPNVYWLTAEDNYAGRMLYDRVGAKSPFIRYNRKL